MTGTTRMRKRSFYYLILAAAMLLSVAAWQVQIIEVALPKKGNQKIAVVRVSPGDTIKLCYRHSNELIQVEGRFSIDDRSRLHAKETRFESSGSGLPVSFPERTTRKGKWMVVDEMNREVGTIRFYIVPINQTRLIVANQPILISSLKSGTLIEVKASRVSGIKWLLMGWSINPILELK